MSALVRIVRGPRPPFGVPYFPHPSIRCRLGLHLWAEVWTLTETSMETDETGLHTARFGTSLDRPADFTECQRCNAVKHDRRLARRLPKSDS